MDIYGQALRPGLVAEFDSVGALVRGGMQVDLRAPQEELSCMFKIA
jgi:hypothetical protein